MQRCLYLHDGSFEGLLHAVAAAVKSYAPVHAVCSEKSHVPSLFDRLNCIETNPEQAQRLLDYLRNLDSQAARFAVNGYLSEDDAVGMHLYHFVRLCLQRGAAAVHLHSNDSVRYLNDTCRKVGFEAHRLKGLLRFSVLENGLQYAPFESDHNVIGFCALHFQKRLAGRKWILHDIGRDIALHWDGETLQPVTMEPEFTQYVLRNKEIPDQHMTDSEQHYRKLWRSFHTSIAIAGRKNRRLQRQLMPKRYWNYLTEMEG